jgi:PAS domain S-box-containing protein
MFAPFYHLVGGVLSNLLILVGLTYLVSLLIAAHPPVRTAYRGAVFGLALGVVCSVVMFASIEVRANVFLDLRFVVILMSALLGGPVAALVTSAIAILIRAQMTGGVLVPAIVIVAAALLGIAARMLGAKCTLRSLLALGFGLALLRTSAPLLSYLLGNIDFARAQDATLTYFPILAVLSPIATFAMGGLLKFEGRRLDQEADLKSENKALVKRDEQFQTVFDLSNAAMLWTSQDSRIVRANQRMAELVGYTVDELQAMNYEELIPLEDRPEYYRIRDQRLATGVSPKDLQRRYLRKDGGTFWPGLV